MRSLLVDNRGVGWILGIAVLAILIMPVIYFPLSFAWDQVSDLILADYVFTGVYASSYQVVSIIISYLLAFGLLFTINWAIVQAKRERYQA